MRKGDRVSFSGIFLSSFLVTKQWNLLKAWPDIGDRSPLLSRPRLHTAAPLTAPLGQPTVDDSGHQDVPCHLVALDGGSLGREYSGAHFLPYMTTFLGASLNVTLVFQIRELVPTRVIDREGNDNPLQYSCLENSVDRGAYRRATVHRVSKSRTRLSDSHSLALRAIHTLCHQKGKAISLGSTRVSIQPYRHQIILRSFQR